MNYLIAAQDRVRRFDSRRCVEYAAAGAYAEQARARAEAAEDPIDRALLAAVAGGSSIRAAAVALEIPASTAVDIVRRLMG